MFTVANDTAALTWNQNIIVGEELSKINIINKINLHILAIVTQHTIMRLLVNET